MEHNKPIKKKSLVLIISSMRSGGAERVMANLANALVERGYAITLILFTPPSELPFYILDERIKVMSLNCLSYNKSRFIYFKNMLYCLYFLRKTLRTLKVDMIVSFMESVNMAVLVSTMGFKIPVIISERVDPAFHRISRFYAFGRLRIYRLCQKLIVQTKSVYDYFPKDFGEFMEIIPNPVKMPDVQKLDHAEMVTNIVTVGRLTEQKNQAMLIRAFAQLAVDYPEMHLTILGEGQERSTLEVLIKTLNLGGKVQLMGAVKNVKEFLIEADLFVFPSLYEGFPNALCEAMSIGVPVIASNVTGNRDLVKHEDNGLLFDVMDISDLVHQMKRMLDRGERQRMSLKAKDVIDDYHYETIYERWMNVIDNV